MSAAHVPHGRACYTATNTLLGHQQAQQALMHAGGWQLQRGDPPDTVRMAAWATGMRLHAPAWRRRAPCCHHRSCTLGTRLKAGVAQCCAMHTRPSGPACRCLRPPAFCSLSPHLTASHTPAPCLQLPLRASKLPQQPALVLRRHEVSGRALRPWQGMRECPCRPPGARPGQAEPPRSYPAAGMRVHSRGCWACAGALCSTRPQCPLHPPPTRRHLDLGRAAFNQLAPEHYGEALRRRQLLRCRCWLHASPVPACASGGC